MDFAFKLAAKLYSYFGCQHIEEVMARDGVKVQWVRTTADVDEEKENESEEDLQYAPTDRRRTQRLNSSTAVVNNGFMLPYFVCLKPGM